MIDIVYLPPTLNDRADALDAERMRERAMRKAIAADDIARAHEVLALMSPEERARWSAPMPEQDAAVETAADPLVQIAEERVERGLRRAAEKKARETPTPDDG